MAAVANNPSFAKKAGVPQSVGKDFTTADKGRKFLKGGDTMASKMNPGFMAMMAKKKGAPAKKMAGGGMPMKDGKPAFIGDGKGMKHGGMAMKKMANGGSASKRADGIAIKGHTKGTEIGMKRGGKAC
jgi:hypothetical protein